MDTRHHVLVAAKVLSGSFQLLLDFNGSEFLGQREEFP